MENLDTHIGTEPGGQIPPMVFVVRKLMLAVIILVLGLVSIPVIMVFYQRTNEKPALQTTAPSPANGITSSAPSDMNSHFWKPADISAISDPVKKADVEYGRELITHTAKYFGPGGSLAAISNGMNCQNCHLQAGTAVFANNYGSVASMYPKFRARSGSIENLNKRVIDCFERSLNGHAPDSNSHEMRSILSYIEYIGSNVPKGSKAEGSGLKELAYLDRAASPDNGRQLYQSKCASCHQPDGQGVQNGAEYVFPPLWGPHSYNDGAGLYRISNFARYVKFNMPQGTSYDHAQLSDEEAWDLAAFINSQPRPHLKASHDWPDISQKPIDHPFGPYADKFSENQHKYGPFKPMLSAGKAGKS